MIEKYEPAERIPGKSARPMLRAELMGAHSHATSSGVNVHIWSRRDRFLARGYHNRRPFGETLGKTEAEATVRLRRLLTEIEDRSFVPPSEARKQPLATGPAPRLTLREVINA